MSNPCTNMATCVQIVRGFWCSCLPGFSGAYCESEHTSYLLFYLIVKHTVFALRDAIFQSRSTNARAIRVETEAHAVTSSSGTHVLVQSVRVARTAKFFLPMK